MSGTYLISASLSMSQRIRRHDAMERIKWIVLNTDHKCRSSPNRLTGNSLSQLQQYNPLDQYLLQEDSNVIKFVSGSRAQASQTEVLDRNKGSQLKDMEDKKKDGLNVAGNNPNQLKSFSSFSIF